MPEDYFKLFREAMAVFQHAQMCVYNENFDLGVTIVSIMFSSSLDLF